MNRTPLLEFDPAFLAEETRCGFTIPEKMKRVWATELEMLSEVDRVCRKYELTYFADWGTMLGAVRHNGFIPWDDDIDLCMPRTDYLQLLRILPDELPEYIQKSVHAPQPRAKLFTSIMNADCPSLDESRLARYYGNPFVSGLDIFPVDVIEDWEKGGENQLLLYSIAYDAAGHYEEHKKEGSLEHYLKKIEELTRVRLRRDGSERIQLVRLCERLAGLYAGDTEGRQNVTEFWRLATMTRGFILQRGWYASAVEFPFESLTIPVPCGYRDILTAMYGEDYMTFKQGGFGSGHEYPYYRKQEEWLNGQNML